MDFPQFAQKIRSVFKKPVAASGTGKQMADPFYYLAPGFDPNHLTIAELSSILAANDISVPQSKAKKSAYVELFLKNITTRRAELLKRYKVGVKAKATGIVAVSPGGTENKLDGSDFEDEKETKRKNRRSSSVGPVEATPARGKRHQSPERHIRTNRKKAVSETQFSQVNDFQNEGENSPPHKANAGSSTAAAAPAGSETPRRKVQLRRPMTPSASGADMASKPPSMPSMFSPKRSTALYDMPTWVKKTVDISDPVDDVYGTGPGALRALKNIPFEKDLQCQIHVPAITRASQLIGLRLLDENIFNEILKKVAEAPNRLRLRDAVEGWLNAHGITFGDKKLGSSMTPKHASTSKSSTADYDFATWVEKPITTSETVDSIWGTGPVTLDQLKALPMDAEFVGFFFVPAITTAAQLLGLRLVGKDEFDKVMHLTHPSFLAPNIKRLTAAVEGWLEQHGVICDDREIDPALLEAAPARREPMDLLRRLSRQGQSPEKPKEAERSPPEGRRLNRNLISSTVPKEQEESAEPEMMQVPEEMVEPSADQVSIASTDSALDAAVQSWVMSAAARMAPSAESKQVLQEVVDRLPSKPAKKASRSVFKPLLAAAIAGSSAFGAIEIATRNPVVSQTLNTQVAALQAMLPPMPEMQLPAMPQIPTLDVNFDWRSLPGLQHAAELGAKYVMPTVSASWDTVISSDAWKTVASSDMYKAALETASKIEIPDDTAAAAVPAGLAAVIAALLTGSRKKKATKHARKSIAAAIAKALQLQGQGMSISGLQKALAKENCQLTLSKSDWRAIQAVACEEFGVAISGDTWFLPLQIPEPVIEIIEPTPEPESLPTEEAHRGRSVLSRKALWEKRAEADRIQDPKERRRAIDALETFEPEELEQ